MRGHIFLEFLMAFLAMVVIIQLLVGSQGNSLREISQRMEEVGTKMELEKVAAACDLLYFNWKSADMNFSFSLPNLMTLGNVIMSEENGSNLSSECLSNISGVNSLEVVGVRKWF